MVGVNFVLVCSLYLAALVLWDKHLRFRTLCRVPWPRHLTFSTAASAASAASAAGTPSGGVSLVHRALHAFASAVGRVVIRHRLKFLASFVALSAVMVGFAATLPDPSTAIANPYWAKDHPLGRRWALEAFVMRNASDGDAAIDVRLVMGLDGIDRSGTDPSDDDDLGEPLFSATFDFADPAAQVTAPCIPQR